MMYPIKLGFDNIRLNERFAVDKSLVTLKSRLAPRLTFDSVFIVSTNKLKVAEQAYSEFNLPVIVPPDEKLITNLKTKHPLAKVFVNIHLHDISGFFDIDLYKDPKLIDGIVINTNLSNSFLIQNFIRKIKVKKDDESGLIVYDHLHIIAGAARNSTIAAQLYNSGARSVIFDNNVNKSLFAMPAFSGIVDICDLDMGPVIVTQSVCSNHSGEVIIENVIKSFVAGADMIILDNSFSDRTGFFKYKVNQLNSDLAHWMSMLGVKAPHELRAMVNPYIVL